MKSQFRKEYKHQRNIGFVTILIIAIVITLILTSCAITPNGTTDRVLTILGQALVAKSASGGYDYQQGLRDSQNYVNNAMKTHNENNYLMQPKFEYIHCNRYANQINCTGQRW